MTNDSSDPAGRGAYQRIRGRYPLYTRTRIKQFARRLRHAIYPDRVPAARIEIAGPTDRIAYAEATALAYRPAEIGEMLGPLWATYWVRVTATIPHDWKGTRVDLFWDSQSEALLWLGGRSAQGLNIGRNAATLAEAAEGGETITFYIEVACNRAFGAREAGYPPDEPYMLAACELRRFDPEAWALFHDFDTLRQLEADREPPQTPRSTGGVATKLGRPALDTTWAGKLLHELNRVCNALDPDDPSTWPAGRAILSGLLAARNGSVVHEVSAIGHAHIDTAWLWPIEETRRKCQRSFANVLALMARYPEFKFTCSQAAQYAMMEECDPDLFARIGELSRSGQWVPIGGSWVEPDCNLPSGESIARQFLYGQRYFEKHFGARSRVFWNPDVFGYAGQLPQLMREAGMDRFLTQKLSWNRFTTPPHHSFHWRGIDGSTVLTHFPPADTYNGAATIEELRYHAANYKDADRSSHAAYLFGYGDGGGGPDADMIETLRRTGDLLGVPRTATRDPNEFFDRLGREADDFATIEGELYFEYHRGTYTSQAEIKRLNRLIEGRLQDLDLLCVVSALAGKPAPAREAIENFWRVLLTNQFHDILPGSSIAEVYVRARREMAETAEAVQKLAQKLLDELGEGQDCVPFNTIGVARDEIVETPDGSLQRVTAEPFSAGRTAAADDRVAVEETADGIVLENARLRAVLTADGTVRSLLHKASGREALSAPGNRFVVYDDRPTEYEAWDIDPFALETGKECAPADDCTVVARSPMRGAVRFVHRIGERSRLVQTVQLDAGTNIVVFETEIDWQERRTLLKVAFPVTPRAQRAAYETMSGAVERPTHANTDADLAQFEVPAHRWADLSEPGFGVSLINDSRYGHSTFDGTMTLSLLRGTMSPDARADIGTHRLRYALYPHAGDWREAGTVGEALRFNRPLLWSAGRPALKEPPVRAEPGNVLVDTIKPAENGDGWIVRLYESHGRATDAVLRFGVPVRTVTRSNTLEDRMEAVAVESGLCRLSLRRFQIATLRIS